MKPVAISARPQRSSTVAGLSRLTCIAAPAVIVLALLVLSAPALAAGPEAPGPVTVQLPVGAMKVAVHGVLSPQAEGHPGTYEFLYKKGSGSCEGEGKAPESPGVMLGFEAEAVSETLVGLEPSTEYTVCLLARNSKGEETAGPAVTFTTALALEAPTAPEPNTTGITTTTATLHGVLNPNAAGEAGDKYEFRYRQSASECEGGSATPAGTATGATPEPVEAQIAGLSPGATYTFCLVAQNGAGEEAVGPTVTFKTVGAPVVSEGRVTSVAASTAMVSAEITPDGAPTGYHVEYVTEEQFKADEWAESTRVPASDAELPAGDNPISVNEHLDGLASGTVYRFRFVATNAVERLAGTEATFTTVSSAVAASELPDNRAYELVSPPDSGELYEPPTPFGETPEASGFKTGLPFRAASDGEAIAYVAEPATTTGSGETGPAEGNQWLARRGPSGWQAEDITPAENTLAIYESFSEDLATGFYEGDATPLQGTGVEKGCAALYTRAGDGSVFAALFTSGETPENCGHPLFAGAAADESQVYFQSEAALTTGASEATLPPGRGEHRTNPNIGEGCQFGCNLYASVGGNLQLVNVLEGQVVPSATFGGYNPSESELPNLSDAISADGSRVFWTDTQAGPDFEHVYVLENGASTIQVSGSEDAKYWAASAEGRYAYYTEDGALWRFNSEPEVDHEAVREQLATSAAEVQGVIGTNQAGEEGAYLYFVAKGALSGALANARGEHPEPGECSALTEERSDGCNLYLLHGGVTSFIARLSGLDNELGSVTIGFNGRGGDWRTGLGERTAELTPDGRHLVFESTEELTGYKSGFTPENGSRPEPGVFAYFADDGDLTCVSCSPTGAEPVKPLEEEVALASKLPISREAKTFLHRWISEDGARVFFDSTQPLVPQDKNGVQDVYEWERPAEVGEADNTCTTQEESPVTGGCTFLLSGGASTNASFLVDADATGNNVFFEHIGPLGQVHAPVDHNELYDARVNGGFPEPSLACTGTGCQGVPPAPPTFATPSSATFSGAGNAPPPPAPTKTVVKPLTRPQKLATALKACKRDKRKSRREDCEKQARKRYGAKKSTKAKKAGNERRAQS